MVPFNPMDLDLNVISKLPKGISPSRTHYLTDGEVVGTRPLLKPRNPTPQKRVGRRSAKSLSARGDAMAAAAVVHLSVHGRLRRSPELHARPYHRPSLLRCRAFKQEADNGGEEASSSPPPPTTAEARRRRKGPLYKLKAAIQGLAGSRSAAAEAYGGEYQRAVEKAREIFFSVSCIPEPPQAPLIDVFFVCFHVIIHVYGCFIS